MFKILASGFFSLCYLTLNAQEILTLEEAIQIGLKNNYSINIARNDSAAARNNSNAVTAGFLPDVNAYSSGSRTKNDLQQNFSSGLEINRQGVISKNLNAGIEVGLTVFDGFKMFATYDKIKELEQIGLLRLKLQIENTIAEIINAYYNIVLQKQLAKTIEYSMTVYDERVSLTQAKLDIGIGNKTELLQAKIDKNARRSALLTQKTLFERAKITLNELLARPLEIQYSVVDSMPVTYNPAFEDLRKSVQKQNINLLLFEKNTYIGAYEVREMQALRYPTLRLTSAYNINRSANEAGFQLSNQSKGLNYGFTATWSIFNGFSTNRQIKNAKIDFLNDQLLFNEVKQSVDAGLLKTWRSFKDALEILTLEEENFKLVKENLDIALERYKLGLSTSLELKEAQTSYEEAETRLVNARYSFKLGETELKRLNGELVR